MAAVYPDQKINELCAEIVDLKSSVIAFAGPYSVQYAHERGWPIGHLHATHYDILQKAGARMVDFVRHIPEPPHD